MALETRGSVVLRYNETPRKDTRYWQVGHNALGLGHESAGGQHWAWLGQEAGGMADKPLPRLVA